MIIIFVSKNNSSKKFYYGMLGSGERIWTGAFPKFIIYHYNGDWVIWVEFVSNAVEALITKKVRTK